MGSVTAIDNTLHYLFCRCVIGRRDTTQSELKERAMLRIFPFQPALPALRSPCFFVGPGDVMVRAELSAGWVDPWVVLGPL